MRLYDRALYNASSCEQTPSTIITTLISTADIFDDISQWREPLEALRESSIFIGPERLDEPVAHSIDYHLAAGRDAHGPARGRA